MKNERLYGYYFVMIFHFVYAIFFSRLLARYYSDVDVYNVIIWVYSIGASAILVFQIRLSDIFAATPLVQNIVNPQNMVLSEKKMEKIRARVGKKMARWRKAVDAPTYEDHKKLLFEYYIHSRDYKYLLKTYKKAIKLFFKYRKNPIPLAKHYSKFYRWQYRKVLGFWPVELGSDIKGYKIFSKSLIDIYGSLENAFNDKERNKLNGWV